MVWDTSPYPIRDGVPLLPMERLQLLWINLVAAVALALFLASRPGRGPAARDSPSEGGEHGRDRAEGRALAAWT